jgi:hypothetical protein
MELVRLKIGLEIGIIYRMFFAVLIIMVIGPTLMTDPILSRFDPSRPPEKVDTGQTGSILGCTNESDSQ